MIPSYSRFILLKKDPLSKVPFRCLFGFGKKIKNETSLGEVKEGKKEVGVHQSPVKEKQEPIENDLPIKVSPADPEKRSQWLYGRAPIFFIPRRRSGYAPEYEMEWSFRALKQGAIYLKQELGIWWKEVSDLDVIKEVPPRLGETDRVFEFNSPESLDMWVTTCDSDHGEGFSTVNFSLNKECRAVFSGELSTRVPKDGRMQHAGYCNIRSPSKYLSFMRRDYYNWVIYNTIELRIRGDGRTYTLNLHSPGDFDTMQDDMFSHPMYTRGGPYWQIVRIPFSKFIFSNKGRIQDTQYPVPTPYIHYISITIGDNADGPFRLEIDYIGVVRDPAFEEESRFETYYVPNLQVQH